jgi:Fe-S-cluster containining protein
MKKDKYFLSCCERCWGKCCVGALYITTPEYKTLPIEHRKVFKKHYSGYVTQLGKPCPFIGKNGCILGEERFLECKLYPLEVHAIDKLILRKECLHHELFNTKAFFKKGLDLLKEYISKGIFNESDVVSIIHNKYPNKL